jgi:hypothetical protein
MLAASSIPRYRAGFCYWIVKLHQYRLLHPFALLASWRLALEDLPSATGPRSSGRVLTPRGNLFYGIAGTQLHFAFFDRDQSIAASRVDSELILIALVRYDAAVIGCRCGSHAR